MKPHCSWTLFCSWLLPQHRDQALHSRCLIFAEWRDLWCIQLSESDCFLHKRGEFCQGPSHPFLRLQPHTSSRGPSFIPSVGSSPQDPGAAGIPRPGFTPTVSPPPGRLLFQVHAHSLIQLVPVLCSQRCGRWVILWFAEGQAWSSLHFLKQNPSATS